MIKSSTRLLSAMLATLALLLTTSSLAGDRHNVLVVMSYEQNNPWCKEIKEGIDSTLGDSSVITYFYMDTKANYQGGHDKAREAYVLFETMRPDGVITVDDNAQSMFVLPFLYGKTATPIMFCGVNADAAKYGYPSNHISGTLERGHIRESIAFLKQLKPDFERVCFLVKDSPSGDSLMAQVEAEKAAYLAKANGFFKARTVNDLKKMSASFNAQCDAIYIDSLEGIEDKQGTALDHEQIFSELENLFQGPFIGANRYHVEHGALSAVVKTGQEQGALSADMLLKAMNGTPVKELAVTRNYQGRRIINVTAMRKHQITPRPIVLRGVTLVK